MALYLCALHGTDYLAYLMYTSSLQRVNWSEIWDCKMRTKTITSKMCEDVMLGDELCITTEAIHVILKRSLTPPQILAAYSMRMWFTCRMTVWRIYEISSTQASWVTRSESNSSTATFCYCQNQTKTIPRIPPTGSSWCKILLANFWSKSLLINSLVISNCTAYSHPHSEGIRIKKKTWLQWCFWSIPCSWGYICTCNRLRKYIQQGPIWLSHAYAAETEYTL